MSAAPRPGPDVVVWEGSLDGWTADAARGSTADLATETAGPSVALRFAFALADSTSWAIARREIDVTLPESWVATLRIRGTTAANELQVKLVDTSKENVWWWRRRDGVPATERLVLRRATLEFAWGPASGGEPGRLSAVEVAVAAGPGGAGYLVIDDFRIEPREPTPEPPRPRAVVASSAAPGHDAARVLDGQRATTWRPDAADAAPTLTLDLGRPREWGGLVVHFVGPSPACRVATSDDGTAWTPRGEEPAAAGGSRWLAATELESRFARLELSGPAEVADVTVAPIELAVSPVRWAAAVARASPRGCYPRHLLDEAAPWAAVGADGDGWTGLLGEDGALEVDAEAFTIEPFLWTGGRLVTWDDVRPVPTLADGSLPVPSVDWTAGPLGLRVTAFVAGPPGRRVLVARYRVESADGGPRTARLLLAIRPFQVLPPWQRLNVSPAVAPIRRLEPHDGGLRVDGARDVVLVTAPDAVGAAPAREGLQRLFEGRTPDAERVEDPLGFAEAVLAYDLDLAGRGGDEVVVAMPRGGTAPARLPRRAAAAWGRERLDEAVSSWTARLAPVPLALPPCADAVVASLRASIAWILVNRDGPRIQPGPRCYRRSWIRDGTLTGMALAEMGFADVAREFLRWYAPYQAADGRVPCAVDRHGVDPVAEHDSHGQLVWGVVDLWRLTGDRALLSELWPHVLGAVGAIERLRNERTTEAFRGTPFFGLLPESISHEGYASRPVHSYWDDLFALRGLTDAAEAAAVLGDAAAARRIAALRDAMRADVRASVARVLAERAIDFVPGSADLADFDPTSTAIAFDPCDEADGLPRAALERTFDRYWEEVLAREAQRPPAYAPYEIRNVLALLALGWKDRALALLDRFVADQRPTGWRQWPEISWRDPRAPRFLGDLPHGWVASTFVRTVRRLVAWERGDGVLLVGAGVPEAWVREEPGVRVAGMPTWWGPLHLTMRAERADRILVGIGAGLRPPGGLVLESPAARPLRAAVVDGVSTPAPDPRRLRLETVPAEVVLLY